MSDMSDWVNDDSPWDGTGEDRNAKYLECPCCGEEGAWADEDGYFKDGQTLTCGCPGHVSIDDETGPWINTGAEPCLKCEPEPPT